MPSTTPRSTLRTKLTGLAAAAKKGRSEGASLLLDDISELLALVAQGDAAVAYVRQIATNPTTVSLVKIVDDARSLEAQWPVA